MNCLQALVSRERLSLSPLSIGAAGDPVQFDGASNASRAASWSGDSWRRSSASSPWVHGEHMVGARKTNGTIDLALWIIQPTLAEIEATWDELRAAVTQWDWTLTLVTDTGTDYVFDAWMADVSLAWDRTHLWSLAAGVQVSVPVMPYGVTVARGA